ncbi:hypothetical protein AB0H43_12035 [Hamadaea sp. NPDC050747]|uniref:hypothetical protein n=1 Tax=Hamadaea sp. NPDC050747 TaxID=3155789 RepID=UPI0033F28AD9
MGEREQPLSPPVEDRRRPESRRLTVIALGLLIVTVAIVALWPRDSPPQADQPVTPVVSPSVIASPVAPSATGSSALPTSPAASPTTRRSVPSGKPSARRTTAAPATTKAAPPDYRTASLAGSSSSSCSGGTVTIDVYATLSGAPYGTNPRGSAGQADSLRSISYAGSGTTSFTGDASFYGGGGGGVSVFGNYSWSITVTLPDGSTVSDSGGGSWHCF